MTLQKFAQNSANVNINVNVNREFIIAQNHEATLLRVYRVSEAAAATKL